MSREPPSGLRPEATAPLYQAARAGAARIPVKLHRRVCLILTEDAVLAEELLAAKRLAGEVVGRLTDRVLLIRPGRVEAVVHELQRAGHTPAVVNGTT